MKTIYVNTWPTRNAPWLVAGDVDPRELYLVAKTLERLGGDYVEAPRDWAPPRYYTITYIPRNRKVVEIVEIKGGNKWRWPGGPWRREVFHLLADKLMDYYGACAWP